MSETQEPDHEDRPVRWREFNDKIDKLRWEFRALSLGLVTVINFDIPNKVTAAAIALAVCTATVKGLLALVHH